VQYLAWLVPWVVGLGAFPTALHFMASGAFLFLVYNYWSQGIPWYLADSVRLGDYQGHLDYFQIACWLSVFVMLIFAWKQIRTRAAEGQSPQSPSSTRVLRFATGSATFVLLVFPMVGQARKDTMALPWAARQNLASFARSSQFSDLSYQLYRMGRYQDAVVAAQQSIELNPYTTAGYTNLAASYASLHLWDQALQNAQQALRLQPDSQLAKNNLDWILQQKQLGRGAPTTLPSRTAPGFLNLSVQDYKAGHFKECIAEAEEALRLKPDMAEAYNNIAACNSAMARWDEAISAAEQALRLKPDFQLARNNFAWAIQQKRIQAETGAKQNR
jgi:tetratricopeptide (TPR) repeat protein